MRRDERERLSIDLANQLVVNYCFRAAEPVRPGEMMLALSLEAEELLGRRAMPVELFSHVLMCYMDCVHEKHRDGILAQRKKLFPE